MKTVSMTKILRFAGASLLSLYLMPVARAQTTESPAPNAFQTCAQKNNIALPEKGSGPRLSQDQRQVIGACIKEARSEARQTCATQNNITLPEKGSGQKLSAADRKVIGQCMANAGFRRFKHHPQPDRFQQEPSAERADVI